jgi:glutaredoxin-dependent peroxiredoxin
MLGVGDTVPAATVFLGPGQALTLQELVEDGPKLLVFYPFDWSSTCTNEMELIRDAREAFEQTGVQPVGISRDSPWTHIAWTQVLDLNFGLLSDFNGEAVRAFGVGMEYRGFRDVARRSAFLVGEDSVIRATWSYDTGEVPDVVAWLDAARSLAAAA